jgi:hypothetical protein
VLGETELASENAEPREDGALKLVLGEDEENRAVVADVAGGLSRAS